ncbi:MAG: dTDP-4-dehydrorhamnose reductase [Planctomycetota bacterium]|jgi:dTDP-4-dehydrorhamnose reductase
MLLVTGAGGQLGSAFRPLLPDGTFVDVEDFDLRNVGGIGTWLQKLHPDGIINCAACTDVDRAEGDRARANTINGLAVGAMARYAASHGIPFMTFSTADVFDGRSTVPYDETAHVAPANAYGRSKLLGERMALDAHPRALVIRSSWLLSSDEDKFVARTIRAASAGDIEVSDDQRGCPTIVDDLAEAAVAAMRAEASGILHLTNTGAASWYEIAREVVRLAGLDAGRVKPCPTHRRPVVAPRPMHVVLGSDRLGRLGVRGLPSWRASLPAIVERITPTLRVA